MDELGIDKYLFNEMSETEREQVEEAFLTNDDLFFEVVARENELVDGFVRDGLPDSVRERFDRTLKSNPARNGKVANARLLREFIANERLENKSKTITIAERSVFFAKLADVFSFRSPAFQFASIGVIAVLALGFAFLLIENRRLTSMQTDLAEARGREAGLVEQIANERETSEDLAADLNAERTRIAELEGEVAKLGGKSSANAEANIPQSTIAAFVLSPIQIRGSERPLERFEIPAGATRATIVINLPEETGDLVSVQLNGEGIADKLRVRIRQSQKSVSVTVPVARIKDRLNRLEILSPTGETVVTYSFSGGRK